MSILRPRIAGSAYSFLFRWSFLRHALLPSYLFRISRLARVHRKRRGGGTFRARDHSERRPLCRYCFGRTEWAIGCVGRIGIAIVVSRDMSFISFFGKNGRMSWIQCCVEVEKILNRLSSDVAKKALFEIQLGRF